MKKYFSKCKIYALSHKKTSIAILLMVLYLGYFTYGKITDTSKETRYVTAAVEKGTLIASVSGSGQVSSSNQIDIKPKVSGDVVTISVKSGQTVKAGDRIASLDATDALKAVRDAEVNLETAKLSYAKLVEPNDALSELQWQNTIAKAKESKKSAEDNLQKAYDDGFNNVSNAYLQLPDIMTGLKELLYNSDNALGGRNGQQNIDYYTSRAQDYTVVNSKANQYRDDVNSKYNAARTAYEANFQHYKSTTRISSASEIEALISESYETTKMIADTVKSANNLIQYYKDQIALKDGTSAPLADTHLATLSTYTGQTNSFLTNLLGSTSGITSNKNTIVNSDRTIAENDLSFKKFQAGADTLDIRNAEIAITQKRNALSDTQTTLSYYYLRAPFDGLIAKINVEKGDTVSNGTSIVTLVTKQQIATLSMNEVDVAKIKTGQKATLTFDAVEELTITGIVSDVDTIGAVTQGVATYNVKIAFDTQDDRVKPGMTVSAVIVTDVKTDALIVTNSAVKTSSDGTRTYIEMFDAPLSGSTGATGAISKTPPKQITVTTGITNDTQTEILSGLSEGDLVITRTTTGAQAAAKSTTVNTRSLFGGGGSRPGG